MNVRKAARRCYKLLLFLLPVCLIISYSAAYDFTFKPCTAPSPQKIKRGGTSLLLSRGAENPIVGPLAASAAPGQRESSRYKTICHLDISQLRIYETLNTWSLGGRRLHISKILENKLYSIEKATVLPRKRRKVETARELRYDI